MQIIYNFVFHYPLFMAFVFMFGGLIYHFFREKHATSIENLSSTPLVSVIIPCHNEEECIRETINYLDKQQYPNFEIIAVNDGSNDRTLEILEELQQTNERLRIVTLTTNQGKGMGLTMGAIAAKGEFLVCIDADALLDAEAIKYFIWHFLNSPRVGAITGNPRVRNRTSILGKIQVGEFSSIIGMIKRTQRILGKLYTVSGVISAFRKKALFSVGFWSNDMVTEDIDISWKLQTKFWDIRYEPRALCWILMPETIKGLWRQRLRWSQGGSEVLKKYTRLLGHWKQRRMWPIYFEYALSVTWSYLLFSTILIFVLGLFIDLPATIKVRSIIPGWTGRIRMTPDDYWTFEAEYEDTSLSVPLRSRTSNIEVDEFSFKTTFRASELFNTEISYSFNDYSDGNENSIYLWTTDTSLLRGPYLRIRLGTELSYSENTQTDVSYFSPSHSYSFYVIPMIEHVFHRRYEKLYAHRIYIAAGQLEQKDYSAKDVGYISYEQDYHFSDTFWLLLGATYAFKNYDGEDVNELTLYSTCKKKF